MPCTVVYKGKTYTDGEFADYVNNNIWEFTPKLSGEMARELGSPKYDQSIFENEEIDNSSIGEVSKAIEPNLIDKTKSDISIKYGVPVGSPGFQVAVGREVVDSLFNRMDTEVGQYASNELIKSFAQFSKDEIDKLDGFERKLYNVVTDQKTSYKQYPTIKDSEIAFSKDGKWEVFNREELIQKAKEGSIDIDANPGLATFLAVEMMYEDKANQTINKDIDYSKILSENSKNELTKKLLLALERLGFSTVKLSDYIQAHKLKTGVDPSVNALADMVKRIVAISEDGNVEELLSEEVAHVLTETYNNQDEIRAVLPEVENTDTWKEHSATYFKLYEGKGLTGEQLTEKVRREILGKLIADKITETQISEPTTFLGKVGRIISNFFSGIKANLKPSVKTRLDNLINTIAESTLEEEKLASMFNSENLDQNPFGDFYNAEESVLTAQLSNMLRNSRKLLSKNRGGNLATKIDTLSGMVDNNFDSLQTLRAVSQYLDITNTIKKDVTSKIKKYEAAVKSGNTPKTFLSSVENASVNVLVTESLPHLQTAKATLTHLGAPTHATESEIKSFNNFKKKVASQLDGMIKDVNEIKGNVILKNTISGQTLLESMIQEYDLSPTAAQEIREYLSVTYNDISVAQMFFGNLQNAPNPILALFSRIIGDIHHRTDVATKHYQRSFIDLTKKLGIPQENLQSFFDKVIQRTPEGKLTGYLQGVIDWGKFSQAEEAVKISAYNNALHQFVVEHNAKKGTNLTYKPITKLNEIGTRDDAPSLSLFTGNVRKIYQDEVNEWRDENYEQPYNKSFRQERKKMLEDIRTNGIKLPDGNVWKTIPESVEVMMSEWATERRKIKAPYIKNGGLDYSLMSEIEKNDLDNIKRHRLEAKSLVDPITGELKSGDELDIAYALQAIEQFYVNQNIQNNSKRKVKTSFIDSLKSFGSDNIGAFKWFNSNSGLNFNENFWKKLDTVAISASERFKKEIAQSQLSGSEKLDYLDKVRELENLQKRRSQFLKQFKNPTSPAEVDTFLMSNSAQAMFVQMETDIEKLFKELNTVVEENTGTTIQNNLETESTANESFERDYNEAKKDDPTLSLFDFARRHMTKNSEESVSTFIKFIDKYEKTGDLILQKGFKTNVRKMLGLPSSADNVEIKNALYTYKKQNGSFETLKDDFLKSKLTGYYKRFAPKGFNEFYSMVKSGNITDVNGNKVNLSDLVETISFRDVDDNNLPAGFKRVEMANSILDFIEVNSEVEWMEDESGMTKNPNYIEDTDTSTNYGGYGQPKFSKYKNDAFINKYNIDTQKYFQTGETESKGTSPENQKELELLKFLVHSRYNNFKQQNTESMSNSYTLPGVRKAAVAKTKDFIKNPINATREWYDDFIKNTVDKKIFGESITGEMDNDSKDISNLVVPTLNVQPLENLEDTSTDLLYSYVVHTYNANLFVNRQDAFTKANQLETLLLSRDFKSTSAKDSNAHKVFQDFKKAYILGVQETKRIKVGLGGRNFDLTNILRSFDRALGTVNVGLNPAISITAGTSALTFSATEALVGQYVNKRSFTKGLARFHSKAGSFLSETGQIDKTNEIYLFGERFGLYGIINGVENSGENRFVRELMKDGISGAAHMMTEMMTKPFAPSTMYAVLDDHRYMSIHDASTGKDTYQLTTYLNFKELGKKEGLTNSEIESKWKALESNSVLSNLETEDGMVHYSQKFEDIFKEMYETQEEIDTAKNTLELKIRNVTSTVIARTDAKMPLYDKSMASRNALARFLLRHREWFTINVQNRFKRGHENLYTGQYEEGSYMTLARVSKDFFKAFNPRNDTKLREIFDELTPEEKINLKRIMIDCAISAVLIAFGSLLVRPWADDEKNKDNWKVQFLSYMYFRLSSEQMTSGILGVPSYKDVLEAPIVAMNSTKEIMKPSNWSFQEIDRGPYAGHSKLFKLMAKNTFARHYFDMVHGIKQKSDFYRLQNEWTLPWMQKLSKKEQEAQKKEEEDLRESFVPRSEKFMR